MKNFYTLFFGLLLICAFSKGIGQTIWNGATITFTKADATDPTQPANQDRITPNVWITRANSNGIYNIATEASYSKSVSPANTEWAYGTLANYATLSYKPWETWNGSKPPSMVNKDAVLHIISQNIYIGIKFLSWSQSASGGGFSYQRTTAASLPIVLKQFSGTLQSSSAFLQWQTASEISFQYFDVQHSVDGMSFNAIARINGNQNSASQSNYSYTHTNISSGKHYYRLAYYDLDGSVRFSSIILLSPDKSNLRLQLYPNPAMSSIQLIGASTLDGSVFTIMNTNGQTIKKGILNNQQIKVDELSSGQYWLMIGGQNGEPYKSSFIKR
jgi:hypothetical protein